MVTKKYLVIAHGDVKRAFGSKFSVDKNIERSKRNRQMMSVVEGGGKDAVTSFEVIKVFEIESKTYTLLWAFPKTGRTHQIRVHMANIGHPILGDDKYGVKQQLAERLMLHAYSLEVTLTSGKKIELKADIPQLFLKLSDAVIN